jgi:hypothetical protein
MISNRWVTRWIDRLTDLPAEAPEWTAIANFLTTATAIATEKLRQQRDAGIQQLQQEIELLTANYAAELQMFAMLCDHWCGRACISEQAAVIVPQVRLLRSTLGEYRRLDQEALNLSINLADRRVLRKRLDDLETDINRLYRKLNPILYQAIDPLLTADINLNGSMQNDISGSLEAEANSTKILRDIPGLDAMTSEPPIVVTDELPSDRFAEESHRQKHAPDLAPMDASTHTRQVSPSHRVVPIRRSNFPATHVKVASRFGLPSAGEVAYGLYAEDSEQRWEQFLSALIGSNDLPGAYWLSRSLAECGRPMSISHTLLGSMQAALWLESADDPLWLDLFDAVSNPIYQNEHSIFKLAISLTSCLIAPESGMVEWLNCPEELPEMSALVVAVQKFAMFQKPFLQERLISTVVPVNPNEFNRLSDAAVKWLRDAPRWRTNLDGANDVWRELISSEGQIRLLVEPVAQGDRQATLKLRSAARDWRDRSRVEKRINQLFQQSRYSSGRNSKIVGGRMEHIVRHIDQAVALALSWCDLVDRNKATGTKNREQDIERAAQLVEDVKEMLPTAENAVSRFVDPSLRATASIYCLERSFEKLRKLLRISEVPTHQNEFSVRPKPLLGLAECLSHRLLWCPDIQRDQYGQPVDLQAISQSLRDACSAGATLHTVWPEWVRSKDFRYVAAISSELQTPELHEQFEEALRRARESLAREHSEVSEAVEQALMDGAIVEDHSEFTAVLQSIEPENLMNLRFATDKLNDVRTKLGTARNTRLNHLQEKWRNLEPRLHSLHELEQGEGDALYAFVEKAIAERDLRVLDECLAGVAHVLETEGEITSRLRELPWVHKSLERTVLDDYLGVIANLEDWLNADSDQIVNFRTAVMKGQNLFRNFGLPEVQQNRRSEVADAAASWLHLKGCGPRDADVSDHLGIILRFLGFQSLAEDGPPVSIVKASTDWALAHATVSSGKAAQPIWQLGSACSGKYNVLCLWGTPGVGKIGACLDQLVLSGTGLLMIYLGYLSERQRTELAAMSRERRLAHATLDENLFVFLSTETDHRLPAFFCCSLPFSAASPYTPQLRGDTPEEMFFGRQDMIREIWDPKGSCIIYGGRQLGKSAMQRHLARKYHRPEHQQYVWLKNLGEHFGSGLGQTTDAIWGELRNNFQEAGLFDSRTDDPNKIAEKIREFMGTNPNLRILVLFDEADDFLDADAADRFRAVRPLRDLMLNTDRRFKVVFAGNRHVQRFLDRPDQPFIQFGTPQLVGPMEPSAARDLVRRPLKALGYTLNDSTVLRILSYTNYHAVLIHVFCAALLERLRKHQGTTLPPYEILREDVEAIYRDPNVRKEISNQFQATLALEDDYKVIAWLIIQDQMQIRDSYALPYSAGDVLDLARNGWPLGFQSFGLDLMQVRLSEMCGLGVLVKNLDGCYRLRSPNLVRMMGTEDDIKRHLEAQMNKPREAQRDLESQHAWMDKKGGINRFSPLTIAQERSLNRRQTGVGLVFASEAVGLLHLPDVFQRFVPKNLPDDVKAECREIPLDISNAADLQQWLKQFLTDRKNHERLIVYQRLSVSVQDLAAYVEAALDFCKRHPSPNRWLRILLVFDPATTWRWVSMPRELQNDLEARADCSIQARRWNLAGVRQLVSQSDKLFLDDVCRDLLNKTGGWPLLLDGVLTDCGEENDPRPSAERIFQALESPSDKLRANFWKALGLDGSPIAGSILQQIQIEREIPLELLVPEFFGGASIDECRASLEFLLRLNCVEVGMDSVRPEAIIGRLNTTITSTAIEDTSVPV